MLQGDRIIKTITKANEELLISALKERSEVLGEKVLSVTDIAITADNDVTLLLRSINPNDDYHKGYTPIKDFIKVQLEAGETYVWSNNNDRFNQTSMQVGSVVCVTGNVGTKVKIEYVYNRD
ncbi:MAG: hypothetical protein ACRDD7_12580 [Peptostreptococcaceae bacterium]